MITDDKQFNAKRAFSHLSIAFFDRKEKKVDWSPLEMGFTTEQVIVGLKNWGMGSESCLQVVGACVGGARAFGRRRRCAPAWR